ncbi:hypothetical protein FDE76_15160 [Clostridium botulinum]|uniref:Uncharacterized protein n=2 Tax=Clostridium botulinum TaxID=1491 RepID=A0A0A0UX68_CLOBO|nr:hypothetical protein [Clostridium botulinum]ACD14206.1 hypothetical protein CLL_0026 [Clostridium botulinum B str. Eklund 17B (NRP)]AIW54511.1 hypothetical protein [Clostridium botulinum]AIW54565.1 hypothetical protein [Clostridium botulinum]ALP69011.1 hypothetical protein [Clostridium botulinum]MBY6977860.1 hypothetical protein [Clostridium botulinum]
MLIIIVIILYIGISLYSKHLLYIQSYARFKRELLYNREQNVKRVCNKSVKKIEWICFVPGINLITVLALSIMILIDKY